MLACLLAWSPLTDPHSPLISKVSFGIAMSLACLISYGCEPNQTACYTLNCTIINQNVNTGSRVHGSEKLKGERDSCNSPECFNMYFILEDAWLFMQLVHIR